MRKVVVIVGWLSLGLAPSADARFDWVEDGYFSGAQYLNSLHSEDLRFAYIAGLADGLRIAATANKEGEPIWWAMCVVAKPLVDVQHAFEQHLRNHPELQLDPANFAFRDFVRDHVC